MSPIFISTILQSVGKENLAHYFPYDVKLRLLPHSRSFLANQKARNAIVGAENLLRADGGSPRMSTIAPRDQFKPLKIGENLVVNYNGS